MFLWMLFSVLYFIPGALLLHGSLWFVTRGKHNFYDVLKVIALTCVVFVVAIDNTLFNTMLLLVPYIAMDEFLKNIVHSAVLSGAVGCMTLVAELSLFQVALCAWLIKLDGRERLGLYRSLCVALIQCVLSFVVAVVFFALVQMLPQIARHFLPGK